MNGFGRAMKTLKSRQVIMSALLSNHSAENY